VEKFLQNNVDELNNIKTEVAVTQEGLETFTEYVTYNKADLRNGKVPAS